MQLEEALDQVGYGLERAILKIACFHAVRSQPSVVIKDNEIMSE